MAIYVVYRVYVSYGICLVVELAPTNSQNFWQRKSLMHIANTPYVVSSLLTQRKC